MRCRGVLPERVLAQGAVKGFLGNSKVGAAIGGLFGKAKGAIDDAVIPELYYVFLSDELTPEYIPPEELRKEIALIKFLTKKNIRLAVIY